jgi:tRNA-binding protein
MIGFDDFLKVDIRVGKIIEVQDFPRAKKPSYKVHVDFGPEIGEKWTSVQAKTNYTKEEMVGMSIVGVVNFPPKNIAGFKSEFLLLGVPAENGGLSILVPSKPAQLGGRMY